ncbi:unnamed protein product, partial [marine sediment metagenome]
SAEARNKRELFEETINELLAKNSNPSVIIRSLQKPQEQRTADLEEFAQSSPERLRILNDLAQAYDQQKELQQKRDDLAAKLTMPEQIMKVAGLNVEQTRIRVGTWATLSDEKLKETLIEYLGSEGNLDLLTRYTKMYAEWAGVVDELIDPVTGKNILYKKALRSINQLNLSRDQLNTVLEMPAESGKRVQAIAGLKSEFPDRVEQIDKAVAAFDDYRPLRGGLDDPKDLQRMLKGAGILEFRILPQAGQPDVDMDEMVAYVETLRTKGPKYASDSKYVWCEIENIDQWKNPDTIAG